MRVGFPYLAITLAMVKVFPCAGGTKEHLVLYTRRRLSKSSSIALGWSPAGFRLVESLKVSSV
jgi:hypothetical protein